ncbi:MAG TPA: response regulator transcription factor [Gaiellaceae bacterium]
MRVVVADANLATRTGIRLLLERNGFEISGEAADAEGAVSAAQRTRPQLCLIDARLPGGAVRAAGRIRSLVPGADVVLLAASPDADQLVDALRAGVAGFVLREVPPDGIIRALEAVRRGEVALPRTLIGHLADQFRARERGRRLSVPGRDDVQLTRRQAEALGLLREGLGTAQIAARLDISPVTVRRHLAIVLAKLGAADRAAALRLLEQAGEET